MLHNLHRQRYQEWKQALEQMQLTVATGSKLNATKLQQQFQEIQKFFQQQLVSLDVIELEPADQSRVQSYQTEMSKQLRLLGTDVVFLQAARQPETVKTRQMQLQQRLQTLVGYCDAVLGAEEAGGAEGAEKII